jgi:hypothetical protein
MAEGTCGGPVYVRPRREDGPSTANVLSSVVPTLPERIAVDLARSVRQEGLFIVHA